MKQWVIAGLVAFSFSSAAQADRETCIKGLTDEYKRTSEHFKTKGELNSVKTAQAAIAAATESLKCSVEDIGFRTGESHKACLEIIPSKKQSYACYIESEVGHFHVSVDYHGSVYVVYTAHE